MAPEVGDAFRRGCPQQGRRRGCRHGRWRGETWVAQSTEQSACTTAVVSLGTAAVTSDLSVVNAAPMMGLQSSIPWPAAAAGTEVKLMVAVGDVGATARVGAAVLQLGHSIKHVDGATEMVVTGTTGSTASGSSVVGIGAADAQTLIALSSKVPSLAAAAANTGMTSTMAMGSFVLACSADGSSGSAADVSSALLPLSRSTCCWSKSTAGFQVPNALAIDCLIDCLSSPRISAKNSLRSAFVSGSMVDGKVRMGEIGEENWGKFSGRVMGWL